MAGIIDHILRKGKGETLLKYSPDQLRVPAGNPEGGEWTSEGYGGLTPGQHRFAQATELQGQINRLYDERARNTPLRGYYNSTENRRREQRQAELDREINKLTREQQRIQAEAHRSFNRSAGARRNEPWTGQGKPSASEFQRLAEGKFKLGDFVWSNEPGLRHIGGKIVGEGRVGGKRGVEMWQVRGPQDEEWYIPKGHAVASGIAGATPG